MPSVPSAKGLQPAEFAVNRVPMRTIAHGVASNLNCDFFTFFETTRNFPLGTGPAAGPNRECPTGQPSDRLRLPGTISEKSDSRPGDFAASRLRGQPSTDDQESQTARSVYCPVRNGFLYFLRSTPPSPSGVVEIEPESSVATSIRCMVARVRAPNLKASEASHR